MKMGLGDTWLKGKLGKKISKPIVKTDRDGLSIRVSPKGKLTFQLRYRHNKKACRCDLGSYPAMSLKDARDEATRLKSKLELGRDPKVVRKVEKQRNVEAATLETLYHLWHDSYCVKKKKKHHEILRSFEIYVFPKLGELPAKEVSLQHWLVILEELAIKIPSIADRILVNAKQSLKWGVKRKFLELNVLSEINSKEDLLIEKTPGDRVLCDEEIKYVWLAINKSRMALKNKVFVKLCLIYGCRNGELRFSEKKHFDFKNRIWTIPAKNHKAGISPGKLFGKPLVRPITDEVERLLLQVFELNKKSKFVFTNFGSYKVMGRSATLSLPGNLIKWVLKNIGFEMDGWSIHDLRRTARTNFSSLTEWHIAEVMLGHVLPGESMIYDLHKYLPAQTEALDKWWEKLQSIIQIDE